MPPITCARQTLSAICTPTQPKLLHDVQDVLLQTRNNEGSLGAARRDAVRYDLVCFFGSEIHVAQVEPSLCRRDGITRIAGVCRGVADSRFSGIQQTLKDVDIAPCLSRSAAVWRLCEETEGDDERENGSRSLHDMVSIFFLLHLRYS
jgi:hypothetical protein